MIWAYGQSGVDFYKEDEIKYHGGNRGHTTLGKLKTQRVPSPFYLNSKLLSTYTSVLPLTYFPD